MDSSFLRKAFIIFVIIILPVGAYLFLKTGEDNFYRLPKYGPKEVLNEDTVYHQIPDWRLTAHTGNLIGKEDVKGNIYVTDFFFTTCQGICPRMTTHLTRVQDSIRNMEDVMILSHTVDPVTDTVETLQRYAEEYGVEPDKWLLLTGGKKEIYDLARKGYMLPVQEGDGGEEDFIHSERFVLVDKEGHIRGFYNGIDSAEVDNLIRDINILSFEYKMKRKEK